MDSVVELVLSYRMNLLFYPLGMILLDMISLNMISLNMVLFGKICVENFGKIFRKKLLNTEIFGKFRKKRADPSFQKA